MRISSIQLEIKERPKSETLKWVLKLIEKAPRSDLILLPEIWPIGYFSFSRYLSESEPQDGPTVKALQKKAVELKCHIFTGSFVEREGERLYNTSLLLDPEGNIIAKYRKIHLFGYGSEEKHLLERGREVATAETPWGLAGLSTCYDLRFPELYRKMVDQGAKVFLVASAWPLARLDAWVLFNRARALENLAFLFSCNCAGTNQSHQFAGHSMFVDPLGKVICEAGEKEEIVTKEVEITMVEQVRKDFSALEDRMLK
ncbi:MAG: acyltransferase [Planctomycetes bacterium DG_23]|nr:MAG: acyltransferase [Planctomycetes bacterium DG_23]